MPDAAPHLFNSDNASGVHPRIMEALSNANRGHALAYGGEPWTAAAEARIREHFGADAQTRFVFGGTGANVVALRAVTDRTEAVICGTTAHVWDDECGAPEVMGGFKLLPVATEGGKICAESVVEQVREHTSRGIHRAHPRVLSLTQATEFGTVYTPDEVARLCEVAHAHGLVVHVDGARVANAAASLDVPLRAITVDAGVDLLSLGATKCGAMYGEAIVCFGSDAGRRLGFHQKQCAQLPSKLRYVAAQFDAWLADGLWRELAAHANAAAQRLAEGVSGIPGVRVVHPVEANMVFAQMPAHAVEPLQERFGFHVLTDDGPIVRWVTSFDTPDSVVDAFVAALRDAAAGDQR